MASFFLVLCWQLLWNTSDLLAAEELTTPFRWLALMHSSGDEPIIRDGSFYLGEAPNLPSEEWQVTTELMQQGRVTQEMLCRFPARFTYIAYSLDLPNVDLSVCHDLQTMLQNVPDERVALVFSAENLASPSSMMGHILVKLSGKDDTGRERTHAVSFYTELRSINVPSIIYKSLVTGKPGIFAMTPYNEKLDFYLNQEGRNVWEYELNLTDFDRRLLLLHLWELKQTQLLYFFDDYNCATLTNFILAVADARLLPKNHNRQTPLDVLKRVESADVITNRTVITAPKWRARMLVDLLDGRAAGDVKRFVEQSDLNPLLQNRDEKTQFLILNLTKQYLEIADQHGDIKEARYKSLTQQVKQAEAQLSASFSLDLSDYKQPSQTPPDSQWTLGGQQESGEWYGKFTYLPVSHQFIDDNRQYFSENELQLAGISVLLNDEKVLLDELVLYRATSVIPHKPLVGGLSGRFAIAADRSYDEQLQKQPRGGISGSIGKALEPVAGLILYAMVGSGLEYGKGRGYFSLQQEAGLVVKGKHDFKTVIKIQNDWNRFGSAVNLSNISVEQIKYFSGNWALMLAYSRHTAWRNSSAESVQLMLHRYY